MMAEALGDGTGRHPFNTLPGILSGPAVFLGFMPKHALLTSSALKENVRASVGKSVIGVADVHFVLVQYASKRAKK